MPRRFPQPFWREFTQCWYVQIGKRQIKLAPDRDEAFRLYHQLMSQRKEKPSLSSLAHSSPNTKEVVELLDAFLDWCSRNKAARTFEYYRENIQRFVTRIPARLTIEQLKPFHVTKAISDFPTWGNNTKYDFIGTLKRALNWAVDEELIDRNPLSRMKKPPREAREMAVTPEEYSRVLQTVEEAGFRDLIELAWETGGRVQELRILEARFVDLDADRIVLPPSKAKGKKYHRVIYLTGRARELVTRLCKERPTGPLLRNSKGNAWTKNAINCAFCRLQLALGRKVMQERGISTNALLRFMPEDVDPGTVAGQSENHQVGTKMSSSTASLIARKYGTKFHLGAFRKGYATEALKNGVDTVTVAHLLGHADASMISRVYAKVQQDPRYMAEAARRAKRARGDSTTSP